MFTPVGANRQGFVFGNGDFYCLLGSSDGLRRSTEAALFERDTDPFLFPPHNVAGHAASIGSHNEGEVLGDSSGGRYVEHRPHIRHIANHAGDRAAIEHNLSGFQNAMTDGTALIHGYSSGGY
jgi:hypothetical protein